MTSFLIGEDKNGEEELKGFIEHSNEKHLIIKFTAEWLQTSINLLDVTFLLIEGKVTIDLYVSFT